LTAVGIRTQDLRKVFNSAPPLGAAGGFIARPGAKEPKQPKPQIIALNGVTLEIYPGEIFGLLGPNGAGKSTTVGVMTTRVRATSGQAWIGDHEVWTEQAKVKRLIGVVPQRPNLDFSLTAREILLFHAAYFGIGSKERHERAEALLEKFKLTDRANQMVRGFSGGMMQRLSIARAMMHDPQVLFLDEPSAGLDPQTRILLWEIIREYDTVDHALHGRSGCALPPLGDCGPRASHRDWDTGRTEAVDPGRIPAATAVREENGGFAGTAEGALGSSRSAGFGFDRRRCLR